MTIRRALAVGAIGAAGALFLGGAACQPPSPTPLCGNGRFGEPGSILSADGDHVAFLSDRLDPGPDANSTACDVFVRTLSTGVVERVSSGGAPAEEPQAISADGRLVLFPVLGSGRLVDVDTGAELWSSPARPDALDLTPDGRFLAWAEGATVFRLDRTTGEVEEVVVAGPPTGGGAPVSSVSIADAGDVVAFGAWSGLYTWDPATEVSEQLTSGRTLQSELSPDGATIAQYAETPDFHISLVDRATGEVTGLEHSWQLGSMAWTTEGSWVLFASSDQTLAGDLTSPDPRELGALQVYGYRLRDGKLVRLHHRGFWGWPTGPRINGVFTATDHNTLNSPTDRRFEVVALAP